jgi:hypothetical protein
MTDRAVSDVVGYVLIFSTLIISVGLVSVLGVGALTDFNEHESDASARRGMETLGTNFNDLQSGDVARASEIRLAGGTVSLTDGPTVDVEVDGGGGLSKTYDVGALEYAGNERRFSFTNGAVIQRSEDHSRLLRPPAFLCSNERAVVSIVTIASDHRSVSKDGSVTIHARSTASRLEFPDDTTDSAADANEVTVTVDSDGGAWRSYFERHPHWSGSGDTYSCTAETVYVRETVVDIRFLT